MGGWVGRLVGWLVFMLLGHEPFRGGMAAVSESPTKFFAGSVTGIQADGSHEGSQELVWNPGDPHPRNSHALFLLVCYESDFQLRKCFEGSVVPILLIIASPESSTVPTHSRPATNTEHMHGLATHIH